MLFLDALITLTFFAEIEAKQKKKVSDISILNLLWFFQPMKNETSFYKSFLASDNQS